MEILTFIRQNSSWYTYGLASHDAGILASYDVGIQQKHLHSLQIPDNQ